jgi:ThiF family
MRGAALPAPDTLDPASLDRFIDSLLATGFEPTGDQQSWIGPLHPALRSLTTAETMKVRVRDGWPFLHPKVLVEGLTPGLHRRVSDGDVCLWEEGDPSLGWLTWEGMSARIEQWADADSKPVTATDPALDAHLYFPGGIKGLATIDLTGREIRDWDSKPLRAVAKDGLLKIGTDGDARGRWYVRENPLTPAQTLGQLRSQLRRRQQKDLDEALETVGTPGGISFLVFAWNTPVGPNLLIIGLEKGKSGRVLAQPYEAARTDPSVLLLRAGPDAIALASKKVVILGVGAVGSHVADLLARSGIGEIFLCDHQRLRPGDVVRHAAGALFVGEHKVDAMSTSIFINSRWTTVKKWQKDVWEPTLLRDLAEHSDLVIDTVGLAGFTSEISLVCGAAERPVVSASLYRRGSLGRVRIQRGVSETSIVDRPQDNRFPLIPPSTDDAAVAWEAGCAAPIAQAPPTSVVGLAATTARLAADVLLGRIDGDVDWIDVYRAVPDTSFERTGSYVFPEA